MKEIIAYGENGRNLIFTRQGEAMAYFNIPNSTAMQRHLYKGDPVTAPGSDEQYYLDELERDYGDAI